MESSYWSKQLEEFETSINSAPGLDYRDWQPAKWQSLLRVSRDLVQRCQLRDGARVLELGCGSATILLQFAARNIECVGIDLSKEALQLAERSADSLHLTNRPTFFELDFFQEDLVNKVGKADLVFNIGTIEHFDKAGQLHMLDIHRDLSRRWVLIGLPNLESPVFRSFLQWAESTGQVYPEDHIMYSIPELASSVGLELVLTDGCHLFFGKHEYYKPGFPELDAFYTRVREILIQVGGSKYEAFPYMDFNRDDIEVLSQVEAIVPNKERVRFGFLNYYLLERRSMAE